jgi:hypothetical protein
MATNNKRIQVSELDFDAIKNNLKTYLQGQSQFSDYDFEGSSISVLLDILAYNTHYNALYTNLAFNEMFLDSASKRSSVVSLAKMLGYTPKSATSARAVVNARIISPSSSPDVATIPAMQPFTSVKDNITYTFYNQEDVTVARSSGAYVFSNLTLVEGTPLSYRFVVTPGTRYVVPNPNVDLTTLKVTLQETATSDIYYNYTRSDDLTTADGNSRVYFLKEIDDGLYEITFGDGVLGLPLENGNVITVSYFVSSLDAPNTISTFTYNGVNVLGSNLTITTVAAAYGGGSAEDIGSIKFNAPRMYAAQNRAVTTDDYRSIVYNKFGDAASVQVWGGEDGIATGITVGYSNAAEANIKAKQYGKVFICIKPKSATKLTNQQKELITSEILSQRNIITVVPEIVDPEYFNIGLTVSVYYDPKATPKSATQIESIVKDAILAYNDTELERFDSVLRYSKLLGIIDNADPAITNNITKLMIHHPHSPMYNVSSQYILKLINPISQEGTITNPVFYTTGFYIPSSTKIHYLDDDSSGNVRLYYLDDAFNKVIVNPSIGDINYALGEIVVRNLTITSLDGPVYDWIVRPESYDVVSALNQIVQIDPTNLVVNAIADQTASGNFGAGYNYQFNSIRS